tara:strand:+ start:419 stop:544 length:126 start_codon:yes stop_codon:yes gene_type:complete
MEVQVNKRINYNGISTSSYHIKRIGYFDYSKKIQKGVLMLF